MQDLKGASLNAKKRKLLTTAEGAKKVAKTLSLGLYRLGADYQGRVDDFMDDGVRPLGEEAVGKEIAKLLRSPWHEACHEGGCLARNACPVGTEYRYPAEVQAFHIAKFVR